MINTNCSTVNIKLRSIAVGGDAVGEVFSVNDIENDSGLLGITAFVPFGVPGEVVTANVLERKPKFIRAEILDVIEDSWDRQVPPCSYFKICGGCELQHIDYRAQVECKKEMVIGALRSGKLPLNVIEQVPDLIKSEPLNYRRRIHLHLDSRGNVGFYKVGTRSIVSIQECLIADKNLAESISKIHLIGPKISGRINSIHLEFGENKVLAIFVAPYELSAAEIKQIRLAAKEIFSNIIITSAGREVLNEGHTSFKLYLNKSNSVYIRIPGGGFSQVNWAVNLELIESISEFFRSQGQNKVYDLFAGAGNFAMNLAKDRVDVLAVETDPRLVKLGRETAKDQGLSQYLKFEELSVNKFLGNLKLSKDEKIGVIADPPRSGLGLLTKELTFAENITLISCHLPSFVRDLRSLTELGYETKKIELYDMFPQTTYLESVAFLSKGLN